MSSEHSECIMCRSWWFPVCEKKGYDGVKISSFLSMMFFILERLAFFSCKNGVALYVFLGSFFPPVFRNMFHKERVNNAVAYMDSDKSASLYVKN